MIDNEWASLPMRCVQANDQPKLQKLSKVAQMVSLPVAKNQNSRHGNEEGGMTMADKTCANCVHGDVCENRFSWLDQEDNTKHIICHHFKDRAGIVELPCKVGDTVYIIDEGEDEYSEPYVLDVKVLRFFIDKRGLGVELKLPLGFGQSSWQVIGENVFLTREEAEKALAERVANHG